jgi:Ca-activated chloride channel family protein
VSGGFDVEADYVLDYDVASLERERHIYLLARIKAGPPPGDAERRPLNLSAVLDRSGSMAGDKLEYVKQAAQFLVQRLGSKDRFSVVTYDDLVKVNIAPAPVQHKDVINQAIRKITSGGTTNLSGGWLQGCQLVAEGIEEGQVNRVLLLTDGLANEGVTDTVRLAAMARQKRAEGVTTTTMGVGLGFNEDLLVKMASEGGGAFYFIDNPDQAPAIFSEELQDLLNVVGQNLTITLMPTQDVDMVRQLNDYPLDRDGRDVLFRLGDLYADEVKTLLLELSIPAMDTLGKVEVARLRFEYDELGEDSVSHHTVELPIIINAVRESDFESRLPNPEVAKSALLLRAARAREEAIGHADKGEFEQAANSLKEVADDIEEFGLDDELLEKEHDMLREEAVDMELGRDRYDAYARKTSTTKVGHASRSQRFASATVSLHLRQKASRAALERKGNTPNVILWKGDKLDLDMDVLHIGREDDNDITVPEKDVSGYHCQIVREGDDLYLEDLGSTNGTYANGGLIADRFRLSVGDVVTVGSWLFRFK